MIYSFLAHLCILTDYTIEALELTGPKINFTLVVFKWFVLYLCKQHQSDSSILCTVPYRVIND